jgi:hypothetical protein
MNRLKLLERFALVTHPFGPFLFLALVSIASTGRNLTALFFTGLALFLAGAIFLIVIGFWQRRNGWKKRGLALFICLLVVFVCSLFQTLWIGAKIGVVTVVVRDASNKQPIPNAAVRLFDGHEKVDINASEGQTDETGTCFLNHCFTTIGTRSPIRDTGYYRLWSTLKVDADDYHDISEKLWEFTGKTWPLYGLPIPVVEVNLEKNPD